MTHYGEEYFAWQKSIGEFGGWANLTKFQQFISQDNNVLDFGCGGGYLLANLNCRGKIGIEINDVAREQASRLGITTVVAIGDIPDRWADVIISNSALEHTLHPLQVLSALHSKLRPGGLIVVVTPCESVVVRYTESDPNHHLYTWSPQNIGNLFKEAGFQIIESKPYLHRWPPRIYRQVAHYGGRQLFELSCKIWGHINRSISQVRIIARR